MIKALALLALMWSSEAWATEYRAFTLTDGRAFIAEVLTTEATGMRVRTPQGDTFVAFGDLADMVPVDEAVYAAQDDLYVYVAADGPYRAGFEASYRGLPHVTLLGNGDSVLTEAERRAAALCGTDLGCVVDALDENPQWMWVVVGRFEGTDAVFDGATTRGTVRTHATGPRSDVDAVNTAAWTAIQMAPTPPEVAVVPEPPEPEPKLPRERKAMTSERAVALSFVPVPGLPNAMAGDWTGFGIGMGIVIPATVLWVGATGKTTQSPAGHVLLGVGGFYAATVVTNQVLSATRLQEKGIALGIGPTARGQGAQIVVTVAPR